ncbi:MAG: B12-binding domain-containing radical SAM protein [Polyangiaceae bacterium]|nr:B12-binding domain-containing radical SAM protein [Polyangiaceae bacterium]
MQIELIATASEDSAYLPRLGLGILASLTPPEDEVIYSDDVVQPFNIERDVKDVDLVGISVDSKTARRAYDIADAYRRKGKRVVLGGIHPTACPDEALQHADAVVLSEAEDLWPEVLRDFKAKQLKPIYKGALPDLAGRPKPRRDIFRSKKYIPFQVVQTMRGCPYPCEFCSVSTQNGVTMRFRPADEVLAELRTLGKLILFADDNVMIHRAYSKELFTKMIPLQKHWIGQCSLAAVKRIENVKLMAESGCKALFIGFESVDEETVKYTGKRQNKPSQYKEVMQMLHEHGISTWGSFVFGFDTDDSEVFDRTVEFGVNMQLTMALYAILTPYPGTALYTRLRNERRLTDERWWLRRDHDAGSPYFVPKLMSREKLREGWVRAWTSFYSVPNILKRWKVTRQSSWIQTLGFLPLNIMQNRLAHIKIAGGQQRFRSGVQIVDDSPPPDAPLPIDVVDSRLETIRSRPDAKDQRRVLPVVG